MKHHAEDLLENPLRHPPPPPPSPPLQPPPPPSPPFPPPPMPQVEAIMQHAERIDQVVRRIFGYLSSKNMKVSLFLYEYEIEVGHDPDINSDDSASHPFGEDDS